MKKHALLIVSVVLCLLFVWLDANYSRRFREFEAACRAGMAITLSPDMDTLKCAEVLWRNGYVPDKGEAAFVSGFLRDCLQRDGRPESLNTLNKFRWQIPASRIERLRLPSCQLRLAASRRDIGREELASAQVSDGVAGKGEGVIRVRIRKEDRQAGFFSRLFKRNLDPSAGVLVRLSRHYRRNGGPAGSSRDTAVVLAYARTDGQGVARFSGLEADGFYSVLPIREDCEYGQPRGTVGRPMEECWNRDKVWTCTFRENEHRIRMFDRSTYNRIRAEGRIAVRSPESFRNRLFLCLFCFLAAWWGLFLLSRGKADRGLLCSGMGLTGLCLIVMFSINNPLTDAALGEKMCHAVLFGLVLAAVLQGVDFEKFYQDRYWIPFDPLSRLFPVRRKGGRGPAKGVSYLIAALGLTLLLFTPLCEEVGGMKVNLNLGFRFQPSEIAKFLLIFFMAAFFSVKAEMIVRYSEKGNDVDLFVHKWKMMCGIILGLGLLILLYFVLGDMGPGLVLAFTFILLYSLVKSRISFRDGGGRLHAILTCDLSLLFFGVLSFAGFLLAGRHFGLTGFACVCWFVVWIGAGLARKRVCESAVFFNLIVAAFLFGGTLASSAGKAVSRLPGGRDLAGSIESIGERLETRNAMCANTWGRLALHGGESVPGPNTQVAEGLWGLASGGLAGQGPGNGSPSLIPAFHTDMILETAGEEFGFLGLLSILLLTGLLLRRCLLVGYRSRHPFLFYLSAGIAIVTGVQFVMIALGSSGIIPLTGITVPFLSDGMVSMALNLAALGVVLSVSRRQAESERRVVDGLRREHMERYGYPLSILSWTGLSAAALILGVCIHYQFFARSETLVRPVYVNNVAGLPVIEYNPRISQLSARLHPGDIYDRNGIPVATSEKSRIAEYADVYADCGVACDTLGYRKRFYPFGRHLYFMTGDANTGTLFSSVEHSPRGYLAEARHLSRLRGYDNVLRNGRGEPVQVTLRSCRYSSSRFLPATDTVVREGVQLRDYSVLLPYLKAGRYSSKVERANRRKRRVFERGKVRPEDLQLTVDARLQTGLQQGIGAYAAEQLSGNPLLRVSAVVLDARRGDLLASANWPLPDEERLRAGEDVYSDNDRPAGWKAWTDCDLGLVFPTAPGSAAKVISAMSALQKLGPDAAGLEYKVYREEKIFSREPPKSGKYLKMDMAEALKESSNCYFIHLVNDKELYGHLERIWGETGISVAGSAAYGLEYARHEARTDDVAVQGAAGVKRYRSYIESGKKRRLRLHPSWFWAWGQDIAATPLAMARVASIAADGGSMPVTHYLLGEDKGRRTVIDEESARRLHGYMQRTAREHNRFAEEYLGGKTGTAERVRRQDGRLYKPNDGWYVFFVDGARIPDRPVLGKGRIGQETVRTGPIAVAVRMERLGRLGSGKAVDLTKKVILPVLDRWNYLPERRLP